MTDLEAVIRAIHIAATGLAFGCVVFLVAVARPALPPGEQREEQYRRALRVIGWSLVIMVASGAVWISAEAVTMSGQPFAEAMQRDILMAVVSNTQFGRIMTIRFALAVGLVLVIAMCRRNADERGWLFVGVGGGLLGAALLGTLAGTGHAVSGRGMDRILHLTMDVAHLLAAGAWLGALPFLVVLLRRLDPDEGAVAYLAARRFSLLGFVSVAVLLVSGLVNCWYLLGGLMGLAGTPYGRLLSFKLAVFVAMLSLAAANRYRHTPRLAANGPSDVASRTLRRNAILETVLGVVVVAIVGWLGVSVPGVHMVHMAPG